MPGKLPGTRGGGGGDPYLHSDDPQLFRRQPPHLARQHLSLVQDREFGVGPGPQQPAHGQAEQPEGRPVCWSSLLLQLFSGCSAQASHCGGLLAVEHEL